MLVRVPTHFPSHGFAGGGGGGGGGDARAMFSVPIGEWARLAKRPLHTPPIRWMTTLTVAVGPDAREELDLVVFDFHPGAAAIALHPAGEVVVDPGGVEGKAGGDAFDEGNEGFAVGFAGGGEAEVHGER